MANAITILFFVATFHDGGSQPMRPSFTELHETLQQGTEKDKVSLLKQILDARYHEINNKNVSMSLLLENLTTKEPDLKYILLSFIARLDWADTDAAARLQDIALDTKEDERIRRQAISFLAGEQDFLVCFNKLLNKGSVQIRKNVAASLAHVDPNRVDLAGLQSLFIKVFEDNSEDVQFEGLYALREIADEHKRKPAYRKLVEIHGQTDQLLRAYFLAAKAYAYRKDAATVKALAALLKEKKTAVREVAAFGLSEARVFPTDVLKIINQSLVDPSPKVRADICWYVSYGGPDLAAVMTNVPACLKDQDALARSAAAKAIGSLQLRQYVPQLLKLLEDPDPAVAAMALVGLSDIGIASKEVIQAIKNAQARGFLDAEDVEPVLKRLKKNQ